VTLEIRAVLTPRVAILETLDALQEPGEEGLEAMVLWLGRVSSDGRARITRTYVPRQTAYRSKEGLSLRVELDEMEVIGELLQRSGDSIIAQVHSHPTLAYHSGLDDAKPVVTENGAFSIVVPFFGYASLLDLAACAVYQLQEGEFVRLPASQVAHLFVIGK
jgi:hypothetical protein